MKATFTTAELLELHEIAVKEIRKEFSKVSRQKGGATFQDKLNEINQELGMIRLLNTILNTQEVNDEI